MMIENPNPSPLPAKHSLYSSRVPSLFVPLEGSLYLIQTNLPNLIALALDDINNFTNNNQLKLKATHRLYNIILLSGDKISKFFDKILRILIKFVRDEDKPLSDQVKRLAVVLGAHIEADYYIPILNTQIHELDVSATKTLTAYLVFLSHMIKFELPQELDHHLQTLIKTLEILEKNFKDDKDVLENLYWLIENIIANAGETLVIYTRPIFSILLTIQSTYELSLPIKEGLPYTMSALAQKSGYSSVSDLHSNEISILIKEFTEKKSFLTWNRTSRDRFKFDVIIRNCKAGIKPFLSEILEIIREVLAPQFDLELRMDMLVLIEFLLDLQELQEDLKKYAGFLLIKILIPAAVWKSGKPQIKIRKAAVINIMTLISKEFIESQLLHKSFKELLPVIKTCLDDDWAPDLRFAACNLMEKLLISLNELIESEELRELYPALLQRLDDAQDLIRIEISKAFLAFFACKQISLSEGNFEYVVKTIIVHLDDQNEEIQLAIYKVLRFAARLKPLIVLTEARNSLKKQKFPRKCQELIKFAEELLEEEKN